MATTAAPQVGSEAQTYDYKIPFVIGASAIGTVIEWYDFYLYGVLAIFLAPIFFPPAIRGGRCCARWRRSAPGSPFGRSARSSSAASATRQAGSWPSC